MILDGNLKEDIHFIEHQDVIIIGAGTIGLYLAHTINLKNPNLKIALVESGSEEPTIEFNSSLSESKGKKHSGTLNGRASGIGGTSHLWGGQLAEFERADFDGPQSRWLINYEEMLSYYNKVYDQLDMQSAQSSEIYDRAYGEIFNEGGKIERTYTRWLREPNFYNFFKNDVINNNKIKIIINSTVNDIEFKGEKATSIKCVTKDLTKISLSADKFIFASGTMGINQFFLTTKVKSDVPWKKNNNIGKYFQDHLGGVIGTLDIKNEKLFRKYFENSWVKGIKIQPKLKFASLNRPYQKAGAVAFFTYKTKYENSIMRIKQSIQQISHGLKPKHLNTLIKDLIVIRKDLVLMIYKFLFKKRIHAIFDLKNSIEVNVYSEQIPVKNSEIRIADNNILSNGLFKIHTYWFCDGNEAISIKRIGKYVDSFLRTNGIGKIIFKDGFFEKNDESLIADFHDTNHQCGGLIISKNRETGVVDKDCKAWGTSNVWVAGSAIFPSSSHANSTLTALALAERLVEEIIFK
ncbi:GMC oxidoreductase [Gammaproteobacteria bacterium]|nr:GMC oxidoreductase [Gammaproteobacteria bacterium]